MEIDILDFVEMYRHLAKQALGKHIVIHRFRRNVKDLQALLADMMYS